MDNTVIEIQRAVELAKANMHLRQANENFMDVSKQIAELTTELRQAREESRQINRDKFWVDLPTLMQAWNHIYNTIAWAQHSNGVVGVIAVDFRLFAAPEAIYEDVKIGLPKLAYRRLVHTFFRDGCGIFQLDQEWCFLLVVGAGSELELRDKVDSIHTLLTGLYSFDHVMAQASASIGVSVYPRDGETPEMLLQKADGVRHKLLQDRCSGWCFVEVAQS